MCNVLFNEALFVDDCGEGCPEHNGHPLEVVQHQQSDESIIIEAGVLTVVVKGSHLHKTCLKS